MKEEIIELRKMGFSYNDISKKLNCSKSVVSYHCSKLGDNGEKIKSNTKIKNEKQFKTSNFLLPKDKIDIIIKLRREKLTYDEIREITGVSKNIISKICREFSLIKNRIKGGISDTDIENIRKLYSEIKSIKKVSEILNISEPTIRKYVKFEERKKSELSRKDQSVRNVIEWRKRVKIKLIEYKGGECVECGYNKCTRSLEFHHTDPNEKDFTISGKSWSFERLKKEVDKCILVCSNCHNEIHYKQDLEKALVV